MAAVRTVQSWKEKCQQLQQGSILTCFDPSDFFRVFGAGQDSFYLFIYFLLFFLIEILGPENL